MAQGRQYRRPPITEALVEFQFVADANWNWTVPGRLWAVLGNAYPEPPKDQVVVPLAGPNGMLGGVLSKVHLSAEGGTRLLGVSPNAISVHALAPYTGWDAFRAQVLEALTSYRSVLGQAAIRRIGVRYINKIGLPVANAAIAMDEYFAVGPFLPEASGLPGSIASFTYRVQAPFDDGDMLTMTMASLPDAAEPTFLLDLDLSSDASGAPLDRDAAVTRMDILRERERMAFEAMLRDPARRLFE